nr:alpha/beta hydrolase-fold protein [Lysinibacillus contaminans]
MELYSNHTNYLYNIDVYVPEGEVPIEGFPVYYVLDGASYFQIVKEAVRLQSRNAPKTGVKKAIVVGIGHGADMQERRFYDFTAPAASYIYPSRFKGKGHDNHGGAQDFNQFLEEELKPRIASDFPINTHQQILFGHSLAGYYVLWQLFNVKSNFQRYIAISPSIWWNEHELLEYSQTFVKKYQHSDEKVFIGVGELEMFMVDDAKLVAGTLEKTMSTSFYVAMEENHASIVPTVLSRALRFVNEN